MKKKHKIIIILGIILFVIVAAIIIYVVVKQNSKIPQYYKSDNKVVYNYFLFNKDTDNLWYIDLTLNNKPYNIPFYYTPYDVLDIPSEPQTFNVINSFMKNNPKGKIYVSVDPYLDSKIIVSGIEINRMLGDRYGIFNFDVWTAISKPYNGTEYPVIDCRNATSKQLVVMIDVAGYNSINNDKYCIKLNSINTNESIRVADAFSLRLLGILK